MRALNDAPAFRAPYSQPPSDDAILRLLSISAWALTNELACWPILANSLNWSYRLIQRFEGNDRSRSTAFRSSVCALPIVGQLSPLYLADLEIVSQLAEAYLDRASPADADGAWFGEGRNRMSLAMQAVAERLADADGKGIGDNARRTRIKRARQRIKKHIGDHPIIFSEGDDAFVWNPGLYWLAKLPITKGRPVEQTEHGAALGEPFSR